jgi:hypothetical protein
MLWLLSQISQNRSDHWRNLVCDFLLEAAEKPQVVVQALEDF